MNVFSEGGLGRSYRICTALSFLPAFPRINPEFFCLPNSNLASFDSNVVTKPLIHTARPHTPSSSDNNITRRTIERKRQPEGERGVAPSYAPLFPPWLPFSSPPSIPQRKGPLRNPFLTRVNAC